MRERLLRPYRRRQSASRLLGHRPCRRAAAEGRDGRDHLRSRARDGRQRLGRARHRHAEEEVAGPCPQRYRDRADADTEGRARSRPSAQPRQGDLREPMRSLKLDTPKSLSQRVMQRLRQAIIDGEFALGAAISEEMVANSFGVSRTPVREAMGQLQAQGLVVIRPQVGSFVFTPSADDINALCTFRIALEPKAAELAFRHDREGTIATMSGAIAAMEPAVEARDNIAYGRADANFHEALFAHCGNRYLIESHQLVSGRVAA